MPSVIVPVLSKHKVSTRAKVSIEYKSWTKTLYLESLKTATAKTVLVNKTNPSGIIPIKAATVFTKETSRLWFETLNCLKNKIMPRGNIIIVIVFNILFNDDIISELIFLIYLASLDILAV